jgi:ribonucleotide reductase alpha subunit
LHVPFESERALELNEKIFETIYFAACSESAALAEQFGAYTSFPGSPASKGKLQFDLWNHIPQNGYDWDSLK